MKMPPFKLIAEIVNALFRKWRGLLKAVSQLAMTAVLTAIAKNNF
jgi:hypothetical protein